MNYLGHVHACMLHIWQTEKQFHDKISTISSHHSFWNRGIIELFMAYRIYKCINRIYCLTLKHTQTHIITLEDIILPFMNRTLHFIGNLTVWMVKANIGSIHDPDCTQFPEGLVAERRSTAVSIVKQICLKTVGCFCNMFLLYRLLCFVCVCPLSSVWILEVLSVKASLWRVTDKDRYDLWRLLVPCVLPMSCNLLLAGWVCHMHELWVY